MELSQSFTGLVVLVCAIHLAGMVGRSLFTSSTPRVLEDEARQPAQRSDWYLFFQCSDLTGTKAMTRKAAQETVQAPRTVSVSRQSKRQSRASMSY